METFKKDEKNYIVRFRSLRTDKILEFNIKITPRIRQRCWSTLSGGPKSKSNLEINMSDKNEENKNEETEAAV